MTHGRVEETCREWLDTKYDRCGERAEFILWGKFFAADALGPRCYNHTAIHIRDMSAHNIEQTAVYDLRRVYRLRADYRTLWGMTLGHDGQPPAEGTDDDIERLRQRFTDLNGENQ
jgi:hypothetical protein